MKTVNLALPVTVFINGAYLAPGTPFEIDEDEARRLIAVHGECDGEMTVSAADRSSIEQLNKFHQLNSGANGE